MLNVNAYMTVKLTLSLAKSLHCLLADSPAQPGCDTSEWLSIQFMHSSLFQFCELNLFGLLNVDCVCWWLPVFSFYCLLSSSSAWTTLLCFPCGTCISLPPCSALNLSAFRLSSESFLTFMSTCLGFSAFVSLLFYLQWLLTFWDHSSRQTSITSTFL